MNPLLVFRLAVRLFLILVLVVILAPSKRIQATANFPKPVPQEATEPPQQEKPNANALAEALQLSLKVVRLHGEGKFEEALPLAKRALELREAALGSDHETVQAARLNLAELYIALKKYGEARKILDRLLLTHEKTAGPDDPGAAIFLDKIAFLNYVQQDFSKAEAALKRALAIREKAFGREHPEFATSLHSLAEFYQLIGRFELAEPLYEQAALIREKLLGREHPDYQRTREKYFCVVYETTRGDERKKKLQEFTQRFGDLAKFTLIDGIGGGVLKGQAISLPRPPYPAEARHRRLQGRVVIKVTIDETGKVIEAADMCNGNPLLVRSSLQSARAARFTMTEVSVNQSRSRA